MTSESQIAGAGYILSFFNDIEQLSSYYAMYVNTLLSLQNKYPTPKNIEEMSEEDRQTLIQVVQGLRSWIVRSYIKAKALKDKVESFNDENLSNAYNKVIDEFVPERENIEKFVIAINKAFVDDVLSDLLMQAKDLYARLSSQV